MKMNCETYPQATNKVKNKQENEKVLVLPKKIHRIKSLMIRLILVACKWPNNI